MSGELRELYKGVNSFNHKIANAGFLAVMMVVGIHTAGRPTEGTLVWWWDLLSHYGVFLVAVPFFFVCSGYFLARHAGDVGWYRSACVKRINGLLVPYLIWSLVAVAMPFAVAILVNCMCFRPVLQNLPKVAAINWILVFGFDVFNCPKYFPLWYLRALILYVAMSPLLVWWLRRTGRAGLSVIYVAWCLLACSKGHPHFEGFFGPFFSLNGLFWFAVGCWISMNAVKATAIEKWMFTERWLLLISGIALVIVNVSWTAILGYRIRFLNPVYIPLLLAAFWSYVPAKPWPRLLTRSTFAIYLIHVLLWDGLCLLFPMKVVGVGDWFVKFSVGFVGSWFAAVAISRLLPRISGVLFGGRTV